MCIGMFFSIIMVQVCSKNHISIKGEEYEFKVSTSC